MNQQTRPQNTAVAPLDRGKLNQALVASTAGSVGQFVPTDFAGLMTVSDLMARSGAAIAKHLRNNPGACLSVAMTAFQNGFNPWLLGNDSYIVNDQLAYGGKSIIAMVNNSPMLQGRLRYRFTGEWPKRCVQVFGRIKGEPEELDVFIEAEKITVRNSPLWKQQPDQQLRYFAGRMWARAHMPEVTLGLLADDEVTDLERGPDGNYAPTRPTRADYADDAKTIDADAGQADDGDEATETEPAREFDLVDHVGEVTNQTPSAGEWVDLYADLYRRLGAGERATLRDNNADTWDEIVNDGLIDDAGAVRTEIHAEEDDAPADEQSESAAGGDDGFPGDQPETGSVAWAIALIGKQFSAADLDGVVATIKKGYWADYSTEDKQRVSAAKIAQQQRINGG